MRAAAQAGRGGDGSWAWRGWQRRTTPRSSCLRARPAAPMRCWAASRRSRRHGAPLDGRCEGHLGAAPPMTRKRRQQTSDRCTPSSTISTKLVWGVIRGRWRSLGTKHVSTRVHRTRTTMTVRGPPTTSAAHAALSLPRAQDGRTPGLRSDTLTTATARLGLAEPRRRLEGRRHRHAALLVGQPVWSHWPLWCRGVRAGRWSAWRGGDVVLAPLLREAAQVPPSEIALGDRLGAESRLV